MAVRTTAASNLDTTVATLKTQLATYVALQQTSSPGDAPAKLFWQWLLAQLRSVSPAMAIAINTSNTFDNAVVDKTLSAIDPFA